MACPGPDCVECDRYRVEGWTCPLGTLTGEEVNTYLYARRSGAAVSPGFWYGSDGLIRGRLILRFGLLHLFGVIDRASFIPYVRAKTLRQLRIGKWMHAHRLTVYSAFDSAFPEFGLLPWELSRSPKEFWSKYHSQVAALRWFLDKQEWTLEECAEHLRLRRMEVYAALYRYRLSWLVQDRRIFDLLKTLDPDLYRHTFIRFDLHRNDALGTQRNRTKLPSHISAHGLLLPAKDWEGVRSVALDMEEWSDALEIKPLSTLSHTWTARARLTPVQSGTFLRLSIPRSIVECIRADTVIRDIGRNTLALSFRSDKARSIVWAWYQKRARIRTSDLGLVGVRCVGHRYQARIKKEGELLSLGWFDTRAEAARAYDTKARELYGDKARLNFADDDKREQV